jgi:membrane protein YqaA with SNARE-associated domain
MVVWFKKVYEKVLNYGHHRYAGLILFLTVFTRGFFFTIPSDLVFVPFCLGNVKKSLTYFAPIAILASALGSVVGYSLGYWISIPLKQFMLELGLFNIDQWDLVSHYFNRFGILAVGLGAFTPLPAMIYTFSSGIFELNFPLYLISYTLGRAIRLYLIAVLLYFLGERINFFMGRYFKWVLLGGTILLVGIIIVLI